MGLGYIPGAFAWNARSHVNSLVTFRSSDSKQRHHRPDTRPIPSPPSQERYGSLQRQLRVVWGCAVHDVPNSFPNACQYDAVFHQHIATKLHPRHESAANLRDAALAWIETHASHPVHGQTIGEWIVAMGHFNVSEYVRHMRKRGVRGDAITLLAMAHVLGATIVLVRDRQSVEEFAPTDAAPRATLVVGYYPEVHYVGTRPLVGE